jgi:hypothetical protein
MGIAFYISSMRNERFVAPILVARKGNCLVLLFAASAASTKVNHQFHRPQVM